MSLFAVILPSRRWKLALLLGAFVGALAATGFGAYAAASGGDTINACAKSDNGQLRLNTSGGCLPSEQAIQWNQTGPPGQTGQAGPPGPPGNTDSTVRHMSNFMVDGKTVSTPVSSGLGQLGKLSLSCGSDAGGGFGTIGYTSTNSSGFQERLIFWSPEMPATPTFTLVNGSTTIPWSHTPNDNILFQIMLEGLAVPDHNGVPRPSLTVIHGFVQEFPQYGGCAFYLHVDTSDVNSPETYSP